MSIENPDPVKVLIVDDHKVFADVLRLAIDGEPGLRCVAVGHSRHEALARAAVTEFDVAVVDLELPDADGFEIIDALLDVRPKARILILTAYARAAHARRAIDAGAVGFLGKETSLGSLLAAVRAATAASPALDPALSPSSPPSVELTPREQDVLHELGLGHDAARIADNLRISLYTTRDHIKALMRKLGVQSQLGAVVAAEQLGLLTLGRRF